MNTVPKKYLLLFLLAIILLIVLIFFIFFLQTPSKNGGTQSGSNSNSRLTPTPAPNGKGSQKLSVPQGEGEFSEEDLKEYKIERAKAEKAFADRKKRLPFLMQLPYSSAHFAIEISAYSDTVYISTFSPLVNKQAYREEALDWLRRNGANFNLFTIVYKN